MAALRTDRDKAMVWLMLLGGLRRCEVLGLRMADLRPGERREATILANSPSTHDAVGGHHQVGMGVPVEVAALVGAWGTEERRPNSESHVGHVQPGQLWGPVSHVGVLISVQVVGVQNLDPAEDGCVTFRVVLHLCLVVTPLALAQRLVRTGGQRRRAAGPDSDSVPLRHHARKLRSSPSWPTRRPRPLLRAQGKSQMLAKRLGLGYLSTVVTRVLFTADNCSVGVCA